MTTASHASRFDAVIVGGSLAGCASAIFLARAGLRVAVVERRPDVDAYKVACTHFIQASATETIRRLDLERPIEEAGGMRNGFELWTRWGWIKPPDYAYGPGPAYGFSIRRETLDPVVRRAALATTGVTGLLGHALTSLELGADEVRVRVSPGAGGVRELRTPLLIGADGRESTVARLAHVRTRRNANNRFVYWAYFRGLDLPPASRSRFWHLDPDVGYVLPMDDDVTLAVAMPSRARLPEFKADREAAFAAFLAALPEGPDFSGAEQVSPLLGKLEVPNIRRDPSGHRLALIGDAALGCDPLPGVGCGWAMQSAEWLADSVAPALGSGVGLAPALGAYARRHRTETGAHYGLITSISRAREPRAFERALIKAATRDEDIAARLYAHWQRRISIADFFRPSTWARTALVLGRTGLPIR